MQEKGTTLVEIIIAIFIITLFSSILIADFPRIMKQYSLSRVAYKLAQDIRRVQDLGLSGVQITDNENQPIGAKGYGIYINLTDNRKYIIYADRGSEGSFNKKYDSTGQFCSQSENSQQDCILEIIDISNDNPDLFIKEIKNINNVSSSINFTPPSPAVDIENLYQNFAIGIVIGLDSDISASRTVWVNTSGLIKVQ